VVHSFVYSGVRTVALPIELVKKPIPFDGSLTALPLNLAVAGMSSSQWESRWRSVSASESRVLKVLFGVKNGAVEDC
jgi:hypothetical protein